MLVALQQVMVAREAGPVLVDDEDLVSAFSPLNEIGPCVIATKDETDAGLSPAIEVRGEGEVGVAAHANAWEVGSAVEVGCSLVRMTIRAGLQAPRRGPRGDVRLGAPRGAV